jgi:hypothetical protein
MKMNIDEKGWLLGSGKSARFWAITNRFTNICIFWSRRPRFINRYRLRRGNIRAFVETITQKPLVVISSTGISTIPAQRLVAGNMDGEGSFADCRIHSSHS